MGDADWKTKIDAAHRMVNALCQPRGSAGTREWIMSIPARPDYDPDLVIAAGLRAAEAEVKRLRQPGPPELTWGAHNALVLRIGALNTQNERLRWALCPYANESNWSVYHLDEWHNIRTWLGEHDAWKIARKALEPAPAEEGCDG